MIQAAMLERQAYIDYQKGCRRKADNAYSFAKYESQKL